MSVAFADGDLVVTHSTYENADLFGGPTLVAFDVFRIEDGKVAEHWDNLQAPAPANASGRTLTDGPTEVTDLDKTEANKALVTEFAQTVLLGGAFDRIGEYIIGGDAYLQHNPLFGDGLQALGEAFAAFAAAGNAIAYREVHQIIGQGNFVLMMSEGTFGDVPTAYYDLFRLEDGKIVEHWDVIQGSRPKWRTTTASSDPEHPGDGPRPPISTPTVLPALSRPNTRPGSGILSGHCLDSRIWCTGRRRALGAVGWRGRYRRRMPISSPSRDGAA